jgi:hypothetical protein
VGSSPLRIGADPEDDEPVGERRYRPWYAPRFPGIEEAAEHWRAHYAELRGRTARFSDCFHDQTLPAEVLEAVAANLTILKSPTVMRQADGRLWAWEGCGDSSGCCHGSCTHVWNYAQALPHLFPSLERTLRETEFRVSQDARGHQTFRALRSGCPRTISTRRRRPARWHWAQKWRASAATPRLRSPKA